jgi:hypothetical protein
VLEINSLLDQYVRIDEGTAAVVCAHRSCVQTAAWLHTALILRGIDPFAVMFDDEAGARDRLVCEIAKGISRPSARRIVVIVCEPKGPSFCDLLELSMGTSKKRMCVFRISGTNSSAAIASS